MLMLGLGYGRNRKLRLKMGTLKQFGPEELQLAERRPPSTREHAKSFPEIDVSYNDG